MKKRLWIMLAALIMVLSASVFTAGATVEEDHVCTVCGGSAVSWKPLPQITANTILAEGHYYVPAGGISNTAQYTFNDNTTRCIDLNGSSITSTTRVFNGTNNARINIFGEGTVTGNTAGGAENGSVAFLSTARFYIYGGTYASPTGTPFYLNKKDYARLYLLNKAKIQGSATAQESYAGAIHVESGRLELYGGTVSGGNGVNGGNIYIAEGRLYVDGGTVTGGKATNGGNIYIKGGVDFRMNKGTVTKGTATTNGGNIYIANNDTETPTCALSGGTVSSGSAKSGGGIYMTGVTANLTGTAFKSNSATNGGTVYCASKGVLNMTGGTLEDGKSKEKGGNVYSASTNSNITVSAGTISGGAATANGGNIYMNNGNLILSGTGTVTGGSAVEGGNIYTRTGISSASNTSTLGGTIANGTASTNGGNVFVEGRATLGDCQFSGGTVPGKSYGLDLYCDVTAKLTVGDFNGECRAHIHSMFVNMARLADGLMDETAVSCGSTFTGRIVLDYFTDAPILHGKDGKVYIYKSGFTNQDGSITWYPDNKTMMANYNADVAVIRAWDGELPLSGGNYLVDILGQNVTFTGTGTVTCFDSANDTCKVWGTAVFNGPSLKNEIFTKAEGKTYVALNDNGAWSFHRLDTGITGVSLRPSDSGIYFTGNWACDAALGEKIESYGVAVSLTKMPTGLSEDVIYTRNTGTITGSVQKAGAMVEGIWKDNSADRIKMNGIYGKMPVFASTYVTVDGVTWMGEGQSRSLWDVLHTIDSNMGVYNAHEKALKDFYTPWKNLGLTGEGWELTFAVNEDAAHLNTLYEGTTAYHGEFHDHGDTGGTSDGKLTLAQIKTYLKQLDMDFTTIVDHKQVLHMDLADWDNAMFIGGTEPSTNITDSKATGKQLHYNMIFAEKEGLEKVLNTFTEFKYKADANGEMHFSYPNFTIERFRELIQAVKDNGGMFVFVHPKDGKRYISDDPLDYWFADWTGLEVFYVSTTDARTQNNYKLWTDLLAAGKHVWATAGYDGHGVPSVNTLTTVYAEKADAASYLTPIKQGNMVCGGVGIRMSVGDQVMGGMTDFAGQRLVFSVGDFHSSLYDPTHTYRVELLSDSGTVMTSAVDPAMPFYYAMDAEETAKFYRVEVFDETTGVRIAIGNPIWNN